MNERWVLITQPRCRPCEEAKQMLTERGIPFVAFDIVERPDMRDFLKTLLPNPTTPQVFRDGTRIGGRDDLREYFRAADLCERF